MKIIPGEWYFLHTEIYGVEVTERIKAVKEYKHHVVFEWPGGYRESFTWHEIEERIV